jgi:hypothetical protein
MDFPEEGSQSIQQPEIVRTRCGYNLTDVLRDFKFNLEQPGATHAAKCLHYTADLLASGCFMAWKKFLWDFAFDSIGLGSPRVFLFLHKQFFSLENQWNRYDHELCVQDAAFQKICVECVLVIRSCPRKTQIKMPRVPAETHTDEWIRKSTGSSPSSALLFKVFKPSHDDSLLKRVGEEFCGAVSSGSVAKALFWMKWAHEEDAKMRKEHMGHGLTSLERGPSNLSSKQRTHCGYFFVFLLAEIYKEFAAKGLLRMKEEFETLLNLYMAPDSSFTSKRKMDLLVLCIQIVCEVPRWKVPAAPGLVSDQVQFKRAVEHSEQFFREVLTYDAPKGDLEKEAKKLKAKALESKKLDLKKSKAKNLSEHLDAYDRAMAEFMGF